MAILIYKSAREVENEKLIIGLRPDDVLLSKSCPNESSEVWNIFSGAIKDYADTDLLIW